VEHIKTKMLDTFEKTDPANPENPKWIRSPSLNESDMLYLAQSKVKMTQKDILKSHVSNWT